MSLGDLGHLGVKLLNNAEVLLLWLGVMRLVGLGVDQYRSSDVEV